MQPKVIFAPDATRDLDGIFEYIAQDSVFYAEKVVDDIYARTQMLLEHPELGRLIPERQDGVSREVFQHSWRIMYTTEFLPHIVITRIIHFAQNFRG